MQHADVCFLAIATCRLWLPVRLFIWRSIFVFYFFMKSTGGCQLLFLFSFSDCAVHCSTKPAVVTMRLLLLRRLEVRRLFSWLVCLMMMVVGRSLSVWRPASLRSSPIMDDKEEWFAQAGATWCSDKHNWRRILFMTWLLLPPAIGDDLGLQQPPF